MCVICANNQANLVLRSLCLRVSKYSWHALKTHCLLFSAGRACGLNTEKMKGGIGSYRRSRHLLLVVVSAACL